MVERPLVGGLELGGTKTVLAIGHADGTILDSQTVPTTGPHHLMTVIADYFESQSRLLGPLAGLGAGAFGPIMLDPASADFGRLLETNKPGWSGFALRDALIDRTGLPLSLVTDVGAAGIGEASLGALRGVDIGVYLTVGTGIGGAILCRGQPLPALLHPEIGHMPLRRANEDRAPSLCRFHDTCAEGLAAGPAIAARFGQHLSAYPADAPQIALVADYLGQLCASLTFALSPQRIILGGGVLKTEGLLSQIRTALAKSLNGYASNGTAQADYLGTPALGDRAGIVGALISAAA
jgi:fructokinase